MRLQNPNSDAYLRRNDIKGKQRPLGATWLLGAKPGECGFAYKFKIGTSSWATEPVFIQHLVPTS